MSAPVDMETKTALLCLPEDLEVKSAALADAPVQRPVDVPEGASQVTAIVAVTGVRDEVGDVLVPGAFKQTLIDRPRPKVCLGHDWNRPIGKTVAIKEYMPGERGLPATTYDGKPWPQQAGAVIATYIPDMTKEDGVNAYNSAKFFGPEESTFSFGFKTQDADHRGNTRYVKRVAMYEYGPVLVPANRLATLQDIKALVDSGQMESKASQVRDVAYWGEPYGTPITAHMHPHGPKARAERRQGRTPSRAVGVMQAGQAATPPKAPKPAERNAEIAGSGLFAEPTSTARVLPHPTRAKGADQKHIDNLAQSIEQGNADDDAGDDARAEVDKAIRGLLDEAITPDEVRERVTNHPLIDAPGGQRNYQQGEPGSHDEGIARVLNDYRARYAALAQHQQANTPAPVPAGQFEHLSNAQLAGHRDATAAILGDLEGNGANSADPLHRNASAHLAGVEQVMAARRAAAAEHPSVATGNEVGLKYHARDAAGSQRRAGEMEKELARVQQEQVANPPEQGSAQEALLYSLQALIHGLRGKNTQGTPVASARPEKATTPQAPAEPVEPPGATAAARREMFTLTPPQRGEYQRARDGGADHTTAMTTASATPPRGAVDRSALHDAQVRRHAATGGTPQGADTGAALAHAITAFSVAGGSNNERAGSRMAAQMLNQPAGAGNPTSEVRGLRAHMAKTKLPEADMRARVDSVNATADALHSVGLGHASAPGHQVPLADQLHGYAQAITDELDRTGGDKPTGNVRTDVQKLIDNGMPDRPAKPRATVSQPENAPYTVITKKGRQATVDYQGNHYGVAWNGGVLAGVTVTDPNGHETHVRGGGTTMLRTGQGADRERAVREALEGAHQHYSQGAAKPSGAGPAPDSPAGLHANALARMTDKQAATHIGTLDQDKLREVDAEFGNRADALGHPGTVTGKHQMVRDAITEPPLDKPTEGAVITPEELDDVANGVDTELGIHEHPDGVLEVEPEVADRQNRVAALLTRHEKGTLDLSNTETGELHSTRKDLADELRLQTELARRDAARAPAAPKTPKGASAAPTTRPGLAGAAQDHAEALRSGDAETIARTQARLDSSLRRTRANSDTARALADHVSGGGPDADQLDNLASSLRDESRARRNASARKRRTARRLDRERITSVLGSVDAELRNRGESSGPESTPGGQTSGSALENVSRRASPTGAAGVPETQGRTRDTTTSTPITRVTNPEAMSTEDLGAEYHVLNDQDVNDARSDTEIARVSNRLSAVNKELDKREINPFQLDPLDTDQQAAYDQARRGKQSHAAALEAALGTPKSEGPREAEKVLSTPEAGDSTVPLTDEEYEKHTRAIENKLNAALSAGQSTDVLHTKGGKGRVYNADRAALHKQIVDSVWAQRGENVPQEGRSIIAGGLGGAGKSTVLRKYAGVNSGDYFTINPDDIKEEMANRGMVPHVEGLSPMESSALVHEESSHIANLLAKKAYRKKTNVMWDITMSRKESVDKRIAEMAQAGYSKPDGVFVDIPVETSVSRALARHRRGMEKYRNGEGLGGRYVPPSIIRKASHSEKSSANRHTFDQLKDEFGSSVVYDNSTHGQDPIKLSGNGRWGVGGSGLESFSPNDTPTERMDKLYDHHRWLIEQGDGDLRTTDNSPHSAAVRNSLHDAGAPLITGGGGAIQRAMLSASWPDVRKGTEHTPEPTVRIKGNLAQDYPKDHFVHKSGGQVAANYNPRTHMITMDPKAATDMRVRGRSRGYFADTGNAPFSTATLHHEYGHSLDLAMPEEDRQAMMREVAASIQAKARTKHAQQGALQAADLHSRQQTEDWVKQNKAAIINQVGTYASSNSQELAAELWAEYKLSPHPSEAATIAGRHLSRKRGD